MRQVAISVRVFYGHMGSWVGMVQLKYMSMTYTWHSGHICLYLYS